MTSPRIVDYHSMPADHIRLGEFGSSPNHLVISTLKESKSKALLVRSLCGVRSRIIGLRHLLV